MKKCPHCAEEIQDEAQKCKHCGEFLTNNNLKSHNILGNYKKWVKQTYPAWDIAVEDEKEKTIVLNKRYKSFSIVAFVVLLMFGFLPGLIYAIVALTRQNIITITIYFDDDGKATKVSRNGFKFLADKYNDKISK